jgi:CheY-like chemotaxis protein
MHEPIEILLVDDEPQITEGLKDLLEDRFRIHTATGAEPALEILRKQPQIAVVLSDMRMPGMDGAALLQRARAVAPDTVRMLLTGYSDINAAIAAVNRGQIFRFLTKPCAPNDLGRAFEAAVEQHRLIIAERVLLQQTLLGCLKSLLDVLALVDPVAFGRAQRLERIVRAIALEAELSPTWPLEAAALLSQLGCLELSDVVRMKLYAGEVLDGVETTEVRTAYTNVCTLLASIPRLEPVRDIIAGLNGLGGPVGAQILRLAMEFDGLEAHGASGASALAIMKTWSSRYEPKILDAACRACRHTQGWGVPSEVSVDDLHSGTLVAEDIRKQNGVLIVPRGVELSRSVILHIGRFRSELAKATVSVASAEEEETDESSLVVEEHQVPEMFATG